MVFVLWQTSGNRTGQQVWWGQEGLSEEPGVPQKASLPREARSDLREKEMNWVGRARGDGTKRWGRG